MKWVSVYNENLISMTKSIFRYFHSCSMLLLQETASKKNTGRIDMINA